MTDVTSLFCIVTWMSVVMLTHFRKTCIIWSACFDFNFSNRTLGHHKNLGLNFEALNWTLAQIMIVDPHFSPSVDI